VAAYIEADVEASSTTMYRLHTVRVLVLLAAAVVFLYGCPGMAGK
jgi:hypothetical protein